MRINKSSSIYYTSVEIFLYTYDGWIRPSITVYSQRMARKLLRAKDYEYVISYSGYKVYVEISGNSDSFNEIDIVRDLIDEYRTIGALSMRRLVSSNDKRQFEWHDARFGIVGVVS